MKTICRLLFLCCIPVFSSAQTIKVMTWNIQMGVGGKYIKFWERGAELPSVSEVQSNILQIASLIKQNDPDVVFLQEVSERACVSKGVNLLKTLKEKLNEYEERHICYWRTLLPCYGSICGLMDYSLVILSRHTTVNPPSVHKLYVSPVSKIGNGWLYPQRYLFQVDIELDQRHISLITTHFEAHDTDGKARECQLDGLLQHLRTLQHTPWILGGDLNMIPPDKGKKHILIGGEKRFCIDKLYNETNISIVPDTESMSGSNKSQWYTAHETTHGDPSLILTLDYILCNKEFFSIKQKKVLPEGASLSDHCPIIVEFELSD